MDNVCPDCGHSLVNNEHGPDQNDFDLDGDKLVYLGSCTYCKECQRLAASNNKFGPTRK